MLDNKLRVAWRRVSLLFCAAVWASSSYVSAGELTLQCGPVTGGTVDWDESSQAVRVEQDGYNGQTIMFRYSEEQASAFVIRKGGMPGPTDDNAKLAGITEHELYFRATFVQVHHGVDRIFTLMVRKPSGETFLTMTENQLSAFLDQPQTRTFLMRCSKL